jgi:YD repeat-containing protein
MEPKMNCKLLQAILMVFCLAVPALGQHEGVDPGLRANIGYSTTDIDAVNMGNGNLFVKIGLWEIPQRGDLSLPVYLTYNNPTYTTASEYSSCVESYWLIPSGSMGVQFNIGSNSEGFETVFYPGPIVLGVPEYYVTSHILKDSTGALHSGEIIDSNGRGVRAIDGSGFYAGNGGTFDRNGTSWSFPETKDRNGNKMTATEIIRPEEYYRYQSRFSLDNNDTTSMNLTDTMGRSLPLIEATSDSVKWGSATDSSGCTGSQQTAYARQLSFQGPQGQNAPFKLCYANFDIHTACSGGQNPGNDFIQTIPLLQSIVLPDGKTWTFEYDWRSPGDAAWVNHGLLSRITTPGGATLSYSYVMTGCASLVASKSLDPGDGSPVSQWTYSYPDLTLNFPSQLTTIETLPEMPYESEPNQIVHKSVSLCNSSQGYESETKYYQSSIGSNHLLRSVKTDYECQTNPKSAWADPAIGVVPTKITTTLDDGSTSKVEKDYTHFTYISDYCTSPPCQPTQTTYGTPAQIREFDYGQTSPTRTVTTSYYALDVDPNYLSANLIDLPYRITVQGIGSAPITTFGYDETPVQASGVSAQLLAAPPGGVRGNVTSTKKWLDTSGQDLVSRTSYYDSGMPYQQFDPKYPTSAAATFEYSPTYMGAFLTKKTLRQTGSVQHVFQYGYDFNTGLLSSMTDQNQHVTSYLYDAMRRLTSATPPIGGITYQYPDNWTMHKEQVDGVETYTYFDGLGRPKRTRRIDPHGDVFVETTFDALGRVYRVSNPYRAGESVLYTSFNYDVLNRTVLVTKPDGSTVRSDYSGPCQTITDESGKKRRTCTDALGRLIRVDEPGRVEQ